MSEMRNNIEKLLKSNINGSRIAKETKVDQSQISKLRNGKREIGGLSLNICEKLNDYYLELKSKEKI